MVPILYQTICASFCVIVILSNILSAKMVALPLLGIIIPAGLLTYPLTFLLSDLVCELFGAKRAKPMVYIALAMSLLSFGMIQIVLMLPAQGSGNSEAFQAVLGLSGLRVFSSLASYVASQLVDIKLYVIIKQWTGSKYLWLRNNGSTCVSQIVDTIMIDLIFLWWGLEMPMIEVMPVMMFSYIYKAFFSFACTPLFYFLVYVLREEIQFFQPEKKEILQINTPRSRV